MTRRAEQTLMFQEAGEAHSRVHTQIKANAALLGGLGQSLRRSPPLFVMICARGSSSHAGIYLRYLIQTRLGIPVMPVAPSVSSIFGAKQNVKGALFVAISQSGRSPDIISAAKAAKEGGAVVISIVNDEKSPLAAISDTVIPLCAGEEKSVAATKTFLCSMSAAAQFLAKWGELDHLTQGLESLPEHLEKAFQIKWEPAVKGLENAQSLFVISRGLGLSIAKEAALKFKETCDLHAEAFSAAEVKHGPMALVKNGFPVMIFSTGDETQCSIDDIAQPFIGRSALVYAAGAVYEGAENLDVTECTLPELRPLLTIQTFYRFINALSLRRGLNPDRPDFLNKVTETR